MRVENLEQALQIKSLAFLCGGDVSKTHSFLLWIKMEGNELGLLEAWLLLFNVPKH